MGQTAVHKITYISPKKIEKLKHSSYQNGRGEAWALENVWDKDQACLFTISVELYIYTVHN